MPGRFSDRTPPQELVGLHNDVREEPAMVRTGVDLKVLRRQPRPADDSIRELERVDTIYRPLRAFALAFQRGQSSPVRIYKNRENCELFANLGKDGILLEFSAVSMTRSHPQMRLLSIHPTQRSA